MLKDFLGMSNKKKPSLPVKETHDKSVPAQRFNEMIFYYTTELKSRISEIAALKAENEMLIKTSIKNASRSDELRTQLDKMNEELRILKEKVRER
jgi:septal ring factor EnvC (AmiA/AmiB activator)